MRLCKEKIMIFETFSWTSTYLCFCKMLLGLSNDLKLNSLFSIISGVTVKAIFMIKDEIILLIHVRCRTEYFTAQLVHTLRSWCWCGMSQAIWCCWCCCHFISKIANISSSSKHGVKITHHNIIISALVDSPRGWASVCDPHPFWVVFRQEQKTEWLCPLFSSDILENYR